MGKLNQNCGKVFKPVPDETPVPCDDYKSSDCVFMSEKFSCLGMDVMPESSLTEVMNKMLSIIDDQARQIRNLERIVNKLK